MYPPNLIEWLQLLVLAVTAALIWAGFRKNFEALVNSSRLHRFEALTAQILDLHAILTVLITEAQKLEDSGQQARIRVTPKAADALSRITSGLRGLAIVEGSPVLARTAAALEERIAQQITNIDRFESRVLRLPEDVDAATLRGLEKALRDALIDFLNHVHPSGSARKSEELFEGRIVLVDSSTIRQLCQEFLLRPGQAGATGNPPQPH